MTVFNLLFPVFALMGLGLISRIRGWVTPEQKEGTKDVVFGLFFPILIFNVMLTSTFDPSTFQMIGFVVIVWILTIFIGRRFLRKWHGEELADVAPFMLTTVEGGSVTLPLYTAIVGMEYAVNTVTFDIAGAILAFVVIPILVARMSSSGVGRRGMFLQIIRNPFVLAVFFGVVLNLVDGVDILQSLNLLEVYSETINLATGSIIGLILFTIGYDFNLRADILKPVLRLAVSRIVLGLIIIGGMFLLFPGPMSEPIFILAVVLYFLSPTGFATPLQLTPIFKSEQESIYTSTFISLFMVFTLIVYVFIVAFVVA